MTNEDALKKDLDGFGDRVNKIQIKQAVLDKQQDYYEKESIKIWDAVNQMKRTIDSLIWKIAFIVGAVSATINGVGIWLINNSK